MTERMPIDIPARIEQLTATHSRLLAVKVALDGYLDVPDLLNRRDIQAEYMSLASEARALYAAQCDAVVAIRAHGGPLSADQTQVVVVVEFDLARLARSLAESKEGI